MCMEGQIVGLGVGHPQMSSEDTLGAMRYRLPILQNNKTPSRDGLDSWSGVNSKPDDHPDDISWCVGGIGVPQTRRRSTRGSSAAPQDSPGRSAWPSRRASPTSAAATSSPASTAAASASTKISRCPWVPGGRGLALGWGLCGRWCLQVASRGSQRPGYNCTLTTNNSCLLPLCLPTAVMPVCFFFFCRAQDSKFLYFHAGAQRWLVTSEIGSTKAFLSSSVLPAGTHESPLGAEAVDPARAAWGGGVKVRSPAHSSSCNTTSKTTVITAAAQASSPAITTTLVEAADHVLSVGT